MAKWFTYNELTKSDTANKLKIDNEPKEEATKDNIIELMHSFYQLHFIKDNYIFNNFIVHFALIFYLHKVLFSYKKK